MTSAGIAQVMPSVPWIVQIGLGVAVGVVVLGLVLRRVLRAVYSDGGTDRPDSPPPAHGRNRRPPGA